MQRYERHATDLALKAVAALDEDVAQFTHIVVASCTGFTAPGLDQVLAARLGMAPDIERTLIGFMGCYAAVNALKSAFHIVRSEPAARVLVINLELCTLHLQETPDLETVLSFSLFGDGCTAALVSAEATGLGLVDFRATTLPDSADLITWHIGDQGFDMRLSGKVPGRIAAALRGELERADDGGLLRGQATQQIDLWAVHPGGRTVLDAVEQGLRLSRDALSYSRGVLNDFGNMSSATVMFILDRMIRAADGPQNGLCMSFGPGSAPRPSGSAAHDPAHPQHRGRADGHGLRRRRRIPALPGGSRAGQHRHPGPAADPGLAGPRHAPPRARRGGLGAGRRLRPWRHAARHRPLGAAPGPADPARRHRPQPRRGGNGAGGLARRDAGPGERRRAGLRAGEAVRLHRQLVTRRWSRSCAGWSGMRAAGGSSTTCTVTPSRITASRCWPAPWGGTASCGMTAGYRFARSFRRAEWERMLAEAGVQAEIRWHFPFRYCIGRLAVSPVVVAGGGPAGAAAACLLARAGRPVMLLERDAGPRHKICGEFLSREALVYLGGLGIDVAALGAADIPAMRLVHRGRAAESALPFRGAGLSRLALDEALLRRAESLGAAVHRGVRVRSVAEGGGGRGMARCCRRRRCSSPPGSMICAAARAARSGSRTG
ncbi:MAG: FAD-dependent monooxygenase [Acetobacteraceae bacterium]